MQANNMEMITLIINLNLYNSYLWLFINWLFILVEEGWHKYIGRQNTLTKEKFMNFVFWKGFGGVLETNVERRNDY
jgi:hypothetical protein